MNPSSKPNTSALCADPEKSTISAWSYVKIVFGLAAILAFVHFLHLEEGLELFRVLVVAAAGFMVYSILPLPYRLPLLFALTIAAMFVLLGALEGAILTGFSLALFGIVNLPLSVRLRTGILILAAAALALIRLEIWPFAWGSTVISILGGLFMFRTILFLYEARFAKKTASIWLRLNYFFLLPNLVFVIFPVVDYKTFISNYYSKPAYETYRKGILWMANGVVHLFMYRLIYYYLVPNPTDIGNVFGWLQYVVASYALIVRLAGIFHFSAGVICLFGFELPPTFNHYFFANSFSDLWRRLNMYWRDFMMKVFYYPIYFKVRRMGTVRAIAVSILITFVFNWFLHAYQWFWFRGSFLYTIQDITFWAIFGVAVMLNSIYQARPKKKKPAKTGFQLSESVILTLQIIGTFSFMAFLWSWWTTPSIEAWFGSLQIWQEISLADVLILISGLAALILLGVVATWLRYRYEHWNSESGISNTTSYSIAVSFIMLLALVASPPVSSMISSRSKVDLGPVLSTKLNAADRDNQFKGYYETILSENSLMDTPLQQVEKHKPDDWRQLYTFDALIFSDDLIHKQIKPNLDIVFKGARFQTNDLGLRDRPIEYDRPKSTLRIALLGGSIEMGTGVTTDQTFENLVEDRLTAEKLFEPYESVEIVNFGVAGIHMPQHIARVDKIIPRFQPQVVIYTCHPDEIRRTMAKLHRIYTRLYAAGLDVEYDYLRNLFAELNLPKNVDEATFARAIRPQMPDIIEWGLLHIKGQAEAMGAIPVWMFVPSLEQKETPKEDEERVLQAIELGFYVLDLRDFNDNVPEDKLILAPFDRHPNALGHDLLAQKMYDEVIKNKVLREAMIGTYNNQ